jgi:hypothetical protein
MLIIVKGSKEARRRNQIQVWLLSIDSVMFSWEKKLSIPIL